MSTGSIHGTIRASDGHRLAHSPILLTGGPGFRTVIHSSAEGEFDLTLPYGLYHLSGSSSGIAVHVLPLQILHIDLVQDDSGALHSSPSSATTSGLWTDTTRGQLYPEAFSLAGILLSREPSSVTEPLDLTGLSDNRLAVESQRGFSWTETQWNLQGLDQTDSYQPGMPAILPDIQALSQITVSSAFLQTTSSSSGTQVGLFLSEPDAIWHGAISTVDSGGVLTATNLPPAPSRGLVQQADQFHWFTRDNVEVSGPLTSWADVFASASGQWSSQTQPLLPAGNNQQSRTLFQNARARLRASAGNQFDLLFSGSRLDLSNGGIPAALEAYAGNRFAPSFVLPGGFAGEPESDHFQSFQLGWTHPLPAASGMGVLELRYGYSTAHLNTSTMATGQTQIDLLGGAVTGSPPLANRAVRPRQEITTAWQPTLLPLKGTRHRIVAGGGWKTAEARNRFTTPSDTNLITAAGVPAYAVEFNTPLDSGERVRSLSSYLADHVALTSSLSLDAGALADFSRGSLPNYSNTRSDLISWNSVSPHAGFSWQVPHSHGVVLQGAYLRLYAPLAGRYLDFGDPNSLGGTVYQSGEAGRLLMRFGGPYSSISPSLRRPYSDEFNLGATLRLPARTTATLQLFRRDGKNRVAAINTGVTAQDFTPVSIPDPGPDGIPGTFDDQRLTVYSQNPATFGQDRYLLTNPVGLRILNTGLQAQVGANWRGLSLQTSFVAEKSYGPTNPGDAYYENDPGIIGALFLDPNTTIHAAGRIFVDRGYVAKIQATYQLPSALGRVELASVTDYTDGLVFARQLLVTGLSQGPILVPATVRGSPEGGDRSQYVISWNLRVSRQFALRAGRLRIAADILNLTNAGQRLQEEDLSGPSFNLRLPVVLQPPRSLRLGFSYQF